MPLPRLLALATLGLALIAGCAAPPAAAPRPAPGPAPGSGPGPAAVPGLAVYRVSGDVRGAVARLQRELGRAGGTVTTVDHAANAAGQGQRLRPTTLVVGGHPRVTTPVQQGAAVAGIDLPARFLVWQDERGAVWLGHNSAAYLAARAGLATTSSPVAALEEAQGAVARRAAGTAAPVVTGADVRGVTTERHLATTRTARPVRDVLAALRVTLAREATRPVAAVDHARGAASVGAVLPTSTVVVAGSAPSTARLLAERQTVGIDLPTRFLVWSDGVTTRVSHPDPTTLAGRHGLRGQTPTLEELARTQQRIVAAVSAPAPAEPAR